eukprot:TRINITY_DN26931_c0_g1_i1.p1 TRINITY_DN26931_c0_g1~~TRINITY_DN26931_c0_g1_i1.p1  ORF type:complete len:671 (-),score=93.58 TRINITY_DN26931_c0_g1_i1:465-2477(-)
MFYYKALRNRKMRPYPRRTSSATLSPTTTPVTTPGFDSWSGKVDFSGISFMALIPLLLHIAACSACMLLGFRLAREGHLVLFRSPGSSSNEESTGVPAMPIVGFSSGHAISEDGPEASFWRREMMYVHESRLWEEPVEDSGIRVTTRWGEGGQAEGIQTNSSRAGRHGILVREHPHPDSFHVSRSTKLLDLLFEEQRRKALENSLQPILAITPTHKRTFQALSMVGLVNSLKVANSDYPVLWIVVEAERRTNDTADILRRSGLQCVHLESREPWPAEWKARELMEVKLREVGLRHIREHQLAGVVVFADDSSVFTREFFHQAQKVEWFGAVPVGIQLQQGFTVIFQLQVPGDEVLARHAQERKIFESRTKDGETKRMPIQAPICYPNSSQLIGWHNLAHSPEELKDGPPMYGGHGDEEQHVKERASMVWVGFVMNARLLWEGGRGTWLEQATGLRLKDEKWPFWLRRWEEWVGAERRTGERQVDPRDLLGRLVLNMSMVQVLGDCDSARTMAWWIRAEARHDSRFYDGWALPRLPVVVPSKSTPWKKKKHSHPPPSPLLEDFLLAGRQTLSTLEPAKDAVAEAVVSGLVTPANVGVLPLPVAEPLIKPVEGQGIEQPQQGVLEPIVLPQQVVAEPLDLPRVDTGLVDAAAGAVVGSVAEVAVNREQLVVR